MKENYAMRILISQNLRPLQFIGWIFVTCAMVLVAAVAVMLIAMSSNNLSQEGMKIYLFVVTAMNLTVVFIALKGLDFAMKVDSVLKDKKL